jgi:hypothetical protein
MITGVVLCFRTFAKSVSFSHCAYFQLRSKHQFEETMKCGLVHCMLVSLLLVSLVYLTSAGNKCFEKEDGRLKYDGSCDVKSATLSVPGKRLGMDFIDGGFLKDV